MKKKFFVLGILGVLLFFGLITFLPAMTPSPAAVQKSVESLGMFKIPKFTVHYRVPSDAGIERILRDENVLPETPVPVNVRAKAFKAFKREFIKRNNTFPSPWKWRRLLEKEHQKRYAAASMLAVEAEAPKIKSLVACVEFPAVDETLPECEGSPVFITFNGPLHNTIPVPGPRDNFSIHYDDTGPALYNELYFASGPTAGVIVHHPNLGTVDLRGLTMANYYLEQSEGAFKPTGAIYPKWLIAPHTEGFYGRDSCDGGVRDVKAANLVYDVCDLINQDNPSFNWQDFDADSDGIVDNFTVVHAGKGQEGGGGLQGEYSIWSHASAIGSPSGYKVCDGGAAGCPDRDIYVREYSMDPEDLEVGVIAEEFGHAAFGLPDIYSTDIDNSNANWYIMSAGSWNGPLAGMQPAPFPLWFRMLCGWATPKELDYTTKPTAAFVGQLSKRPKGTEYGLKINLPDKVVTIPNRAGSGQAFWTRLGDVIQDSLTHAFDLTNASTPIFSFNSFWGIEENYDYGYLKVSTDNGATWTLLPDMDGHFVPVYDMNNVQIGWGLTGRSDQAFRLRFDLTAYAGQTVLVQLAYVTDMGVQWEGWFADDFSLDDGATNLFQDDVESGGNGWTVDGWIFVPLTQVHPRYYLVEWRNLSGFDKGLVYPYQTVYSSPTEWEVDRAPYTVPGMLVTYRDASQGLDYTLLDSVTDPPSYGPKFGFLVVDSHSFPEMWDTIILSSGQHARISRRVQAGNAIFSLRKTQSFTLRYGSGTTILETKTFGNLPPVSQFHDSVGYTPGLWYKPQTGQLFTWDAPASAILPAKANYTTRITYLDNSPAYDLYGTDLGFTVLGSGHPGAEGNQYGLHLAVVGQARNGKWGLIHAWNSSAVVTMKNKVNLQKAQPGSHLVYQLEVKNTTPVQQSFVLQDPIPANTTFVGGRHYDAAKNSIIWNDELHPYEHKTLMFIVKINKTTPSGTTITNTGYVSDSALGDDATSTTLVR